MKKEEKIKMILRQLNGSASEKENKDFSQWLLERPENLDLYIEIKALWETAFPTMLFNSSVAEKRITQTSKKTSTKFRFVRQRWKAVAAIAIVLITIGSAIFIQGKVSQLSENRKMAHQVTKTSKSGEKLSVVLPDGSTVRLNAESSIQFPEKFSNENRLVKLSGEAFFEVTKDSVRPFIIQSQQVTTTVLGTSFNLKAFDNEEISITVATGRVQVETVSYKGIDKVFLSPNERAICKKNRAPIQVDKVDARDYYAWTEGILQFNNDSLNEVIGMLARWYNVPIKTQGFIPDKPCIKGSFKDKKLEIVLDGLCFMYNLDYKLNEDNSVIITYKPE